MAEYVYRGPTATPLEYPMQLIGWGLAAVCSAVIAVFSAATAVAGVALFASKTVLCHAIGMIFYLPNVK
jgi:hypothetical protein